MEMNSIVAGVFMVVVAGVILFNVYKNFMADKARKAEIKSLQEQINSLTTKMKSLFKQ